MFPRFDGVIGLVGFLILAYLLFARETSTGAQGIFNSLSSGGVKIISALQGR